MLSKKTIFLLVLVGIIFFLAPDQVKLFAGSIELLRPNGPGSLTQLGRFGADQNWQCVDEAVADDGGYYGGGTYVHKYGSGYQYDLYSLSDFTATGTINSITVYFRCDYEWGVDGWAMPIIRTGGYNYYGPERTLQDEWTNFSYTWNMNPRTGVAWTITDLNQLEAGIGLYGGSDDEARCTQVYILVDYVPWNNFTDILRPDNPGSLTQLSRYGSAPNWQCVEETIADDGGYYSGGTYVHKYGSGYLYDLYSLSDFTSPGTINKITLYFRCDYEWGINGWATPIIRTGGYTYYGPEVTLQDQWTTFSYTWNVNPGTGTAWTAADLNQLEAGIGLYGGSDDEARCTQIYVVVDCTAYNPFIVVNTPKGGENFFRGTSYTINWKSCGFSGPVNIFLLKNGALYQTIAQGVQNTGTYTWNIPGNFTAGSDYKIKIETVNSPTYYGQSGSSFKISSPRISAYVGAYDLLGALGDWQAFLRKCKESGAVGVRLFVCYSWKGPQPISPYIQVGTHTRDGQTFPLYRLSEWNPTFWNHLREVLDYMKNLNLEAWLVTEDFCSLRDSPDSETGIRVKYYNPFWSSEEFYSNGSINLPPNKAWDDQMKQYHNSLYSKIVQTANESGVNFLIEIMNEYDSSAPGWTNEQKIAWHAWAVGAVQSYNVPTGKIIGTSTGTAIWQGIAGQVGIYSFHHIEWTNEIVEYGWPHNQIIWSGDGGIYGNGVPDADGDKGLGKNEARNISDKIVQDAYLGYEFLDRGLYGFDSNRANLDDFYPAPLLELTRVY